jgi:hypothetical protein
MNDVVNDFGAMQAYRDDYQRLGSSEDFRQTGRGMAGVSTSEVGSGNGNFGRRGGRKNKYLTPRERDIRQQQIEQDEMYREQRYGSRSSRDFRKGSRYDSRDDRYEERNGRGMSRWDGMSSSADFRQGAPSSINYPRRQMQRNRNTRGGDEYYDMYGNYDYDEDYDDDEYYNDDVRYNEGRSRRRSMNNDRYGNDDYYDPEIIGRNSRGRDKEKRSVWDNIRDVFKF